MALSGKEVVKAGSALIEELGTNIKVWQEMLKDAVDSGDRELENSLRKEIKDAASEIKKRSTALVPTDIPAKEATSIGLPKGQEAEYLSKQLEVPASRSENVAEQARINRAEAIKRGSAQGTGPTIEAEGTKALVPYQENELQKRIKAATPIDLSRPEYNFRKTDESTAIPPIDIEAPSPTTTLDKMQEAKKGRLGAKVAAGVAATGAAAAGVSSLTKDGTSAEEPISPTTPSGEPVRGVGPLASGKEYGTLLDKLKPTVEERPTKTRPLREAVTAAPMRAPSPAEPAPSPYEQSMAELKGERATAKAERDADLRRAEIGELASIIGRSLTQIGAAASGMRSGADMSGIAQQALVDWDKRKDQVMNLYKQNVAELEGQQTKLERAKERADDKAEKEVYQREQMKLAREKLKQDRDIAAQNSEIKMLSAIATRDAKAIQNSEKQYTNALEELDKQDLNFRKVEELDLEGKDKKVIAGEIAKLLGREAVEEAGIIWGTNVKSKDDLMNIITEKRNEIKAQKDRIKKNLGTITGFQARANAPGPTAPVPAEAPAGQDAQIANYAKQNNLDYNRAKDILVKRGYTPKE